jgi:hypothetical protein
MELGESKTGRRKLTLRSTDSALGAARVERESVRPEEVPDPAHNAKSSGHWAHGHPGSLRVEHGLHQPSLQADE